jgi:signal transduction histidine kinase
LALALAREAVWVAGDPGRLAQIMENLVCHAAIDMQEGGRIWLSAQPEGHQVVLKIRVSGIERPKGALEDILDVFSQAEGALDRLQGRLIRDCQLCRNWCRCTGAVLWCAAKGLAGEEVCSAASD